MVALQNIPTDTNFAILSPTKTISTGATMSAIITTTPETSEARIIDNSGNELVTRYFDTENQALDYADSLGAIVSFDSF